MIARLWSNYRHLAFEVLLQLCSRTNQKLKIFAVVHAVFGFVLIAAVHAVFGFVLIARPIIPFNAQMITDDKMITDDNG